MRCIAAILVLAGTAFAQTLTDPAQFPAPVKQFSDNQAHPPLPCTVAHSEPKLNFGLRFQTGYVLQAPLSFYQGGGHHWYVVFRVTPENSGRPVYFLDAINLPDTLQPDFDASVGGTFLLGEGHYDVKWSLLDDDGRVCRQEWSLDAHPDRSERSTKLLMPPGAVSDLSGHSSTAPSAKLNASHRRITLIMNSLLLSAPRMVRRGQPDPPPVTGSEWDSLLSILESTVEQLPAASVRLVVFNMHLQRELFREDDFTLAAMNRVAHLADGMERWAVDYHLLQNPGGEWDLLTGIVNRELHAPMQSDAVVFLGFPEILPGKMPSGFPSAGSERAPRFFYLQYRPNGPSQESGSDRFESTAMGRGAGLAGSMQNPASSAPVADSIEDGMRHLRGKTMMIYSPDDLIKAIKDIDHAVPR